MADKDFLDAFDKFHSLQFQPIELGAFQTSTPVSPDAPIFPGIKQVQTGALPDDPIDLIQQKAENQEDDDPLTLDVLGERVPIEELKRTEYGQKLIDLDKKIKSGHRMGFWEGFTTDFWSADRIPFLGMLASVGGSVKDAYDVSQTLKKMQNGEPVSFDDKLKTQLYLKQGEYESNATWKGLVGRLAQDLPTLAVEMGLLVSPAMHVGLLLLARSPRLQRCREVPRHSRVKLLKRM